MAQQNYKRKETEIPPPDGRKTGADRDFATDEGAQEPNRTFDAV